MYKKEPIKNYPEYEIDTNGNIYNKDGSLKSQILVKAGHKNVSFSIEGKMITEKVHRLLTIQFIPNPENKPTVNHIDGDRSNNNLNNLEWATQQEQIIHSRNVLGNKNDRAIIGYDKDTLKEKYRFNSLADGGRYFADGKNYRLYQTSIWRALSGIRKTYKGCIWKYAEN